MATLSRKDNGWLIQFFDENKKRRPIYLGKRYSKKTVMELKEIVETLLRCRDNGISLPDKKTVAWIESACSEIQDKLAAVGLIEKPSIHTAEELWNACLDAKQDIKDSTQETYFHARRRFFEFFKPQIVLTELEPAHFQRWKESLRKTLEASTVAGTIVKTKAVFNWAVRSGWLEKSPLEGVGRGSFVNKKNDRFVTMDEYRRLLDACPCQDWRAIIALARIGGLRAPSEVLKLRWADVNWELSRFYV